MAATVQIFSFGYQRSGIPQDRTGNNGGFVFDCRHLPNPGREKQYQHQTGQDQPVIEYLEKEPIVEEFLQDVFRIVLRSIRAYEERGYTDLMVSMGCTGGQHRSIYCAERLNQFLRSKNITTILRHQELAEIRLKAKIMQPENEPVPEPENAGVTSSAIIFCDNRCPYAEFPNDEAVDGGKSCRTFAAIWCRKLEQYVAKNAPCAWRYGKRRPKAGW